MGTEWNQGETLKLIESYRKHNLLWDPKSPHHFNKLQKLDAWEEIGKEMGKSADECKKKVENLLSALRREKMKIAKSIGSKKSTEEVYKSTWYAFESMMFLWDKNKAKQTLYTLTTPETTNEVRSEETTPLDEPIFYQGIQPTALTDTSPNMTSSTKRMIPPTPKNAKKKKKALDERLERAFRILEKSAETECDECYYFGHLVASKLRSYDVSTRSAIQTDILNIFVRANSGFYTNTIGETSCSFPVNSDSNT